MDAGDGWPHVGAASREIEPTVATIIFVRSVYEEIGEVGYTQLGRHPGEAVQGIAQTIEDQKDFFLGTRVESRKVLVFEEVGFQHAISIREGFPKR